MTDQYQYALNSMTGFARCETQGPWGQLVWELRSVNHRYLDISPRLPEALRALEPTVREKVTARIGRGKVEVTARLQLASREQTLEVDDQQLARLADAIDTIRTTVIDCQAPDALDLLQFPGVQREVKPDEQALQSAAMQALDSALTQLGDMRRSEGEHLAVLLSQRAAQVGQQAAAVRQRIPQVRCEQADRMRARLEALDIEADPARLETELVMAAQRMDVAEELDRLEAHVTALQQALVRREPVGRRLDFLMQEFNREANTLGSKSADTEVSQLAVEMKVLIEQMREQVQNVE